MGRSPDQAGDHASQHPARRAVAAFACLALGLILGRQFSHVPAGVWFGACGMLAAAAGLARARACVLALAAAVIFFGAGWFNARLFERPNDVLHDLLDHAACDSENSDTPTSGPVPETLLRVEGIVLDEPRAAPPTGAMASFAMRQPFGSCTFKARRVLTDRGWTSCSATLYLRLRGTTWNARDGLGGFGVHAGDGVQLLGAAGSIAPPLNPGEPDARLSPAQRGVAGWLHVDGPELVRPPEHPGPALDGALAWGIARVQAVRACARRLIEPAPVFSTDHNETDRHRRMRAMIASLFLGQREPGEPEVQAAFTHVGLAHALAISGFHMTVLVGVGLLLLRLAGEFGRWEAPIVIGVVVGYLLLTPAEAPIVRSGVLVIALTLGRAAQRRYDALTLLAWTGIALLIWRPLDLWSLGFQLSLGLTALLLWQGRAFHERAFGTPVRGLVTPGGPPSMFMRVWLPIVSGFKRSLSAAVLCWLLAAPTIIAATGVFNPWAVLTTLIVLPAIVVFMWLGFVVLIVGLILTAFGVDASAFTPTILSAPASWLLAIVERLDSWPGMTVQLPPLSAWWAAAATGTLLVLISRPSLDRRAMWSGVGAILIWAAVEFAIPRVGPARGTATVHRLALGPGSCTVVSSAGETLLWNCGASSTGAGLRTLPRVLRAVGVYHVRTVILAGADLNSFSALSDLVRPLGVRIVWISPALALEVRTDPGSAAASLDARLRSLGVEVRVLDTARRFTVGAAAIDAEPAPSAESASGRTNVRPNIFAIVGLTHDSTDAGQRQPSPFNRILITSELNDADARALADTNRPIHAAVVELPRHARQHAAVESLVARSGARVALSTEPLDHPSLDADTAVVGLAASRSGAVRITLDPAVHVRVETFRPFTAGR